ncbi:MAG: sodium:calcium antiporter [Alphaproteobacteria bacterium]|jgi:cation:H+ antiporter|nr:MAG: sodium:calcium antiporter [Alphaproteobacteria bacterium]|tara:strand:+ start:498 stop:1406 length:909 start_codon:yes stop_codon:yes gene_type:complete
MDIFLAIIGLGLLVLGAEIVIRGSISFGKKINISLFAIGVVIVAGGTSLPELASSINAVLNNYSDLALGAVVGSNIANLVLVMAATTIIFPIVNINKNQINQAWINIFLGIVLIFMTFFYFNYIFGIVAILTLIYLMYIQMKKGEIDNTEIDKNDYSTIISLILIVLGIIFLVFGSDLLVSSAIEIAKKYNVSEAVIGLSLIAFGTSLPELVVGILSAIKKKVDFALGNILGSNIYNVLGVLGISSLFGNFTLPEIFLKQDLLIMVAITSIVLIFMLSMKKIGRIYGILGLSIYVSYLYYIF